MQDELLSQFYFFIVFQRPSLRKPGHAGRVTEPEMNVEWESILFPKQELGGGKALCSLWRMHKLPGTCSPRQSSPATLLPPPAGAALIFF